MNHKIFLKNYVNMQIVNTFHEQPIIFNHVAYIRLSNLCKESPQVNTFGSFYKLKCTHICQ
jgi:hypothetical protein